jgi:hypothetical protein
MQNSTNLFSLLIVLNEAFTGSIIIKLDSRLNCDAGDSAPLKVNKC